MVATINAMTVLGFGEAAWNDDPVRSLQGALPTTAVRYQIVIMSMITAATALGVEMVSLISCPPATTTGSGSAASPASPSPEAL